MPRPTLPKTDELVQVIKALRAEGFTTGSVEAQPDGSCTITWGTGAKPATVSALDDWRKQRDAS